MRFEVLTAGRIMMSFWVAISCRYPKLRTNMLSPSSGLNRGDIQEIFIFIFCRYLRNKRRLLYDYVDVGLLGFNAL